MGETHVAPLPTAVYGVVLLLAGIAYLILQQTIIAAEGNDSRLAEAVGKDLKGKLSALLYASAVGLAFVRPWISFAIYILVALVWFIPDPRIESKLSD